MDDTQVPYYDPSNFDVTAYQRIVEKPWGYENHLVPPDAPYMMKIIHVDAGKKLSLQVHDEKSESWIVVKGEAQVIWENEKGEMITTNLEPGKGLTTKVGQKHRLVGITDCDIFETSTPEAGTTWRLEDDYARPNETPEQRKIERKE